MKRTTVSILLRLSAAAVMTLSGALAAGQSYGTNDQVLTIGGGPLRDLKEHAGQLQSDGYAYTQGGVDTFLTPLPLPEGAELRMLCLYANDHTPGESVSASVVMVKLVPGGGGSGQIATVPNSLVASAADIGYGYYCTGDIGYTLTDVTDVDGDGVPDAVVYYVKVVAGGADPVGVGAIRVTWRRKVSSPPDVPTFADVPASDPAFSHIEALAASGITSGCGNGDFCPGAHLTRRQMAVFLAKALGLHWGSP